MENITRSPLLRKSNELIFILGLGFIFTLAASSYDLFESVVLFVERYNREDLSLLLILSVYTSFGMGIISLRRWMELENTLELYREAEGEIKGKDRMYRALFEMARDAVIISDGKKVLDINKKGCEIFGFQDGRPLNVSLISFIPPEYLSELRQALKETFAQTSSHFEMKCQKPEGEFLELEVCLSLVDRNDNIVQMVIRDVTCKKYAEAVEHETLERLKTVIDNTLCGILLIEASSRKIVNANPVALKTTGYSEKELIGMPCSQLISPTGDEVSCTSAFDQGGESSESLLLKARGETIPILRNVVPVSVGGKGYFVESFIDLSERKKGEEELLQAKLTAEGANRAMGEFLATMSHELRTPLTSIIGFSDIMLAGKTGEFDELNRKFLGNISNSGKHLLSLINNILDISKIEAGKMDLDLDFFSLYDVFVDTRNIVSPLAMKKNISMNFKVESGFFIYADRTRFRQIMYNLVNNAIKFTPEGGSVDVVGSRSENGIKVTVSDTGIGISLDELIHLFKPFKQIDSSLSRKYEGSGLGLVLSKKFVEMHGGSIRVESEPENGSTFTFEMPVEILEAQGKENVAKTDEGDGIYVDEFLLGATAAETDDPGESSAEESIDIYGLESSDGSEPLVMVVEDDELSRELLIFTLMEAGYRVAHAASGKQALSLAQDLKPFIITLDLMMPGMNGWDVLNNLKEDNETAGIPVLVLSADDRYEYDMLLGAFEHLVKPVEKSVLISTLERLKERMKKESPKILIVDDQESMIELIESLIEFEGYPISRAYGGKEAISKAVAELPDAIFLDLMMPDLSGYEVISALKKNPETVDIPIIVCTAKDLSVREIEALNSNVSFVMQKEDLSRQKLLQLIKNLESGRGACKQGILSPNARRPLTQEGSEQVGDESRQLHHN